MTKAKWNKKIRNSKVSQERLRNLIINYEVKKGTPANVILKKLRAKKLGMNRKDFLAKIRIKKGKSGDKRFNTEKNIPIKYRRKRMIYTPQYLAPPPVQKDNNMMFRISLAINDVPVHSKYTSFLLQAFSLNKEFLMNNEQKLKEKLVDLSNAYLGYSYNALSEWNHFNYYIAVESPTEILLNRSVLGMWIFKVERKGCVNYDKSGNLSTL